MVPTLDEDCRREWLELWLDVAEKAKQKVSKLRSDKAVIAAEKAISAALSDGVTDAKAARLTVALAVRLDSAIAVDLNLPDLSAAAFFEDAKQNLKIGARGVGDSLAFSIEASVAPVVGAGEAATMGVVFSGLAPYLAIGGAAYYAHRKGMI